MKLLHTADWHLGRQFEGYALDEDQAAVLEQVLTAVRTHQPAALLIAGDVFDRAAPPESAVRLFNRFIEQVTEETETAVVIIAGNHDSADRIGAMAMLADRRRALVRGPLSAREEPLVLHDERGPVAISALPFGYEFAARECFGDPEIKTPAEVLKAQVSAARAHVPEGARWIIVAHAFVSGVSAQSVERPLTRTAGGIETVPLDVFDGADYVALGHIHRPQTAGRASVRYSGSPLAFGFDEEGQEKSMSLVELDANGAATIELIPFRPVRCVRTLKGAFADILSMAASDDFITAVLTDEGRLIDPMKRLKERFPHACGLVYAREIKSSRAAQARPGPLALDDPKAVTRSFLEFMREAPPSPAEEAIIERSLSDLMRQDEAAA